MSYQKPVPSALAFVPTNTPMFADLMSALRQDTDLAPTRRRDMASGLRRVAKALGLPANDIPCDGRWLQPRLSKVMPAAHGLTAKSWQNAVSDARAAMAHFGIVERRVRNIADLNADWCPLWEAVLASKDPTLPTALCRFVHFLNRVGVRPNDVEATHAEAYLEALAVNEISRDPETAYRAAVNGWNLAGRRIETWPDISLPLPSRIKTIRLPDAAFPVSFIQDVDSLLARLAAPDPLRDDGPRRALRPVTLKQYRRQIFRFASELVQAGVAVEVLTSLVVLLDPVIAERGLRQMLARSGNETTRAISEMAGLLRNLARLLRRPEAEQKELRGFAAKLAGKRQLGMTSRNRTRLRVLQAPKHRLRLLTLPDRIFERPAGKAKPHTAAFAREDALAIGILLVCPLRVKNLAALQLDRDIQRPGDGRVFLVLEEADTKNGRPVEFELPADVVRLLERHLKTRVPYMCPAGTPFLFPQRTGASPIDPNALASRIAKRVRKEIGLEMNAHLFRHFAVMNWLDANPGGYEVARRLLGHSELSHTINMYSGLEIKSATRAFSDLVDELKGATR